MTDNCIFCGIAEKKIKSHIIYENEKFMAFLSIYPKHFGATVVIPKKHFHSYVFDLDQNILHELMDFSKTVAKILDNFFDDVGRTALVFEGFGIDHIHAKLFPMHNTAHTIGKWSPIKSNVNKFFHEYEGYISSHDYIQMDAEILEELSKNIRKKI